MTDSRHYQKITAPIHRSTAYDFNVQLDHHAVKKKGTSDYHSMVYGGSQEDEHLGVKEHEIVVRRKDRNIRDGRLRVFSSLNNYRYFCKGDQRPRDENEFKQKMHDQLEYVGVAITPQAVVARHSNQDSQGFAVTRGGLNTIINNGEGKIAPGQKVYMTFDSKNSVFDFKVRDDHFDSERNEPRRLVNPSHHANGVPHTKVTPIVTTERPVVSTNELKELFEMSCKDTGREDLYRALFGVGLLDDDDLTTVMSNLVDKLLARDYQHIGVAVSGAQKGEPFDIVLCG